MTKEELKQEAEEKCVCTDEAMRIMYGIGYIDGAEPREKKIEELENENANLKSIAEFQQSSNMKRGFEIQKLEKENKLLGKRCNQLLKDKGNLTDELERQFRICEKNADTYYDQRTKAIELLKKWVELYKPKLEGYPITPIQEQTEQFLKEMGKCQFQKKH